LAGLLILATPMMLPRAVCLPYICLYVICVSSVTLLNSAKAVGRNEMPFGKNTRVVPSNAVLDRGASPSREDGIRGQNPQFAAMPRIAKLLCPLLLLGLLQSSLSVGRNGHRDTSFDPLTTTIGPTGRTVALRMNPEKKKKMDA